MAVKNYREGGKMPQDFDFIGFTYNGKHSFDDFGIYRTSDGNRYNDNLVPTMTDKTIDVPGGDGQIFFYTNHKNKQFSISIAFDNLKEEQYQNMRKWLDGKGVYDLIFDEYPNKIYSAKVTGTPSLKTVCFEEEEERIYKGEGNIQFTCYYPYAHSEEKHISQVNSLSRSLVYQGEVPAFFKVEVASGTTSCTVGENNISISDSNGTVEWDSRTGLVTKEGSNGKREVISYTGKSYGVIPANSTISMNIGVGSTIHFYEWYY